MTYFATFVSCLFLSIVGTWCVRNIANARRWVHVPMSDRHMHTIPVPRLGGMAIYATFMTAVGLELVISYWRGEGGPLHYWGGSCVGGIARCGCWVCVVAGGSDLQ